MPQKPRAQNSIVFEKEVISVEFIKVKFPNSVIVRFEMLMN